MFKIPFWKHKVADSSKSPKVNHKGMRRAVIGRWAEESSEGLAHRALLRYFVCSICEKEIQPEEVYFALSFHHTVGGEKKRPYVYWCGKFHLECIKKNKSQCLISEKHLNWVDTYNKG